jgi:uncharacterized SAM-binding protein YcdF (DUF218 family)
MDVLLVFGGEGVREQYACALLERYPNAKMVMAAKPLMKDCAGVRTVIASSQSTREEAEYFSQYLAGMQSAGGTWAVGVVTGPYHLRRAMYWAQRLIRDPRIRLHPVAVPLERYGWRPGWRHTLGNGNLGRLVVREFIRLGYAHF